MAAASRKYKVISADSHTVEPPDLWEKWLEKKYLDTRAKYFKKVSEVLPATKTLRFAQIENRLDLALRLQLAAQIPIAGEKN